MPSGHGGCPSQPDLILQLMFSRATNFPLQGGKEEAAVSTEMLLGLKKTKWIEIKRMQGSGKRGGSNALHLQRI